MWASKRRTLPNSRRGMSVSGELIVKPPKGFNAPSWVRSSLQNPSAGFDDPVELLLLSKAGYKTPMMRGFGMHPSFMIPATSASASGAMFNGIKLDELRSINMGHLNPRLHRETLHLQSCKPTTTTGRPELYSSGSRSCEVLTRSSLDMMMMKTRVHLIISPLNSSSSSSSSSSFCSWVVKDGFLTVNQGIGTARGASPTYQKQWDEHEESESHKDGIPGFPLLNSISFDSRYPKASDHLDLNMPITSFIRMPASAVLHLPARTAVGDKQDQDLEKGGGIGERQKISDLSVIAESLRRQKDPEKYKDEAKALISMGVLYDNAQEFLKALDCYQNYLELCIKLGDAEGEAVAYNYIACSIQEHEDLKSTASKDNSNAPGELGSPSNAAAAAMYRKAAEFHRQHADKGDVEGQFVAYTNLGLVYAKLSQWADAANSHKRALKCATYLENPPKQCVAIGNLGFLLFRRGKMGAAKACIIRYLQICEILGDVQGTARAHYMLGTIAALFKKYKEAEEEFRSAMTTARQCRDKQMEVFSKVQIGIARGKMELSHMLSSEDFNATMTTVSRRHSS
ncbi:unnamed protein product [Sphagnum troendelagicum]|uniref:Uncharacterized protein n=1 Tax=Sphagnum troendelagicum TaxID=128251 RepID=A0ABP0T9E1_9BRYO